MTLAETLFALASLLAVVYVAIAIGAQSRLRPEQDDSQGVNRLIAFTWWPFYGQLFDERFQRVCAYGKVLFAGICLLYVASFLVVGG